MARQRRQPTSLKVDFGGVEEEIRKHTARAAKLPDGDYLFKILDASLRENEDTGARGVNVRAQVIKPEKYKGKTQYGYCSLKKAALWNFRNLINAALGRNVAGKTVNVDLEKFRDKVVGGVVEEDEYEGKIRSRVSTWFPKDEYEESDEDEDDEEYEDEEEYEDDEEDEEEEEEPAPRARKKRRSRRDEEEEDEDLEDVEVEDL